ncbi:hypothetical protein N657DRAFT_714112 [Parathielavia appendiculata]|uniref:C2H2-type domain-containing protein n=1 Tax=Parathielavia appendiculata TaxID=2587402 RepID=A0AAN6YYL2_9PEZI|nr:hypothetical protein N657DRAFT_714112 [Parathielavia appendiculata]
MAESSHAKMRIEILIRGWQARNDVAENPANQPSSLWEMLEQWPGSDYPWTPSFKAGVQGSWLNPNQAEAGTRGTLLLSALLDLRRIAGHGVDKKFLCTVCNTACARGSNLTRQYMKYTGERSYSCECGEAFARPDILKRHSKKHCSAQHKAIGADGNKNPMGCLGERGKVTAADIALKRAGHTTPQNGNRMPSLRRASLARLDAHGLM